MNALKGLQWLHSKDPLFPPGVTKRARVTMTNPTAKDLSYHGILWLGLPEVVSLEVDFSIAAGGSREVSFPITMPTVVGTYPVFISILSEGKEIGTYRATEDVEIFGVAKFEYASDIRQAAYQRPDYPDWARGLEISVDVKNVGNGPGALSATWYIETCYGYNAVNLGTKVLLNPGQTVTLSGQWYWPYGPMEPGEWWRRGYILSEAGPISLTFGHSLYLVSWDIPAQIVSGSEYWATQVIHLPYATDNLFLVTLSLVAGIRAVASQAALGGGAYGSNVWSALHDSASDIPLDSTRDYTIRGIYQLVADPTRRKVNVPARAEYDPSYGAIRLPKQPLPSGIYNVVSTVYHWKILPEPGGDYSVTAGAGSVWGNYVVGQVQVV